MYVPENQFGKPKLDVDVWFDVIDIAEVNEPEVRKFWSHWTNEMKLSF